MKKMVLELYSETGNEYTNCGLGGLASSLKQIGLIKNQIKKKDWKEGVSIKFNNGNCQIFKDRIEINYTDANIFGEIILSTFKTDTNGFIDILGTYDKDNPPSLLSRHHRQLAIKKIFLVFTIVRQRSRTERPRARGLARREAGGVAARLSPGAGGRPGRRGGAPPRAGPGDSPQV